MRIYAYIAALIGALALIGGEAALIRSVRRPSQLALVVACVLYFINVMAMRQGDRLDRDVRGRRRRLRHRLRRRVLLARAGAAGAAQRRRR
jgi:hypothetical protein